MTTNTRVAEATNAVQRSDRSGGLGVPADKLSAIIAQCALNERAGQEKLYALFFSYSMAICKRYSVSDEEAIEIVNDGFLKMFKEIYRYRPAYSDIVNSFKGWLRKIMIRVSIDHYRRNKKYYNTTGLENNTANIAAISEDIIGRLSYDEIIDSMKMLTPAYRTVFNLFIIDGCSHHEIAKELGITVGASKSNLSKARTQLQKILAERNDVHGYSKKQTDSLPEHIPTSGKINPNSSRRDSIRVDSTVH